MKLEDFNYHLPAEMIAQQAHHPRDRCKLLVLNKTKIEHRIFSDLIDYLQPGDVLVINETKVIPAKLFGKKSTGGEVEAILIKNIGPLIYETRLKGRNFKVGTKLSFKNCSAIIININHDLFTIKFNHLPGKELILPKPPYLKQLVPDQDYQTVFAVSGKSLAAPTAGLHFTKSLLNRIEQKGVKIAKVQLDISYETFLPVKDLNTHQTGTEHFMIDKKAADLINSAKRIFAVGTTVLKTLESADYRAGKIMPSSGDSTIFIKPGHQFKSNCTALITNFHLPQSSLLLLVCAYAGTERILMAYQEAVKKHYRFYSLGDAMLIVR